LIFFYFVFILATPEANIVYFSEQLTHGSGLVVFANVFFFFFFFFLILKVNLNKQITPESTSFLNSNVSEFKTRLKNTFSMKAFVEGFYTYFSVLLMFFF
jgi:uncharacterized membrane protein YukC